jgi:hypothetical protein
MPGNDREVFEYLKADQQTAVEIDFLTFAIFAHERQQWCELFETNNGRPPTQPEIDQWISQITDWRFGQMREEAIRFFDIAARAYLSDEVEAAKDEVLQNTIIREVKAAGGFWRQLALALVAAVLAPLIIGGFIAAAIVYDKFYPTISSVSERFAKPPAQTEPEPAPAMPDKPPAKPN